MSGRVLRFVSLGAWPLILSLALLAKPSQGRELPAALVMALKQTVQTEFGADEMAALDLLQKRGILERVIEHWEDHRDHASGISSFDPATLNADQSRAYALATTWAAKNLVGKEPHGVSPMNLDGDDVLYDEAVITGIVASSDGVGFQISVRVRYQTKDSKNPNAPPRYHNAKLWSHVTGEGAVVFRGFEP